MNKQKSLIAVLFVLLLSATPRLISSFSSQAQAQNIPETELSYDYFGQSIPLTLRTDLIAIKFKTEAMNSRSLNDPPLYRQLQEDLNDNSRDLGNNSNIRVQPVGTNYALITVPTSTETRDLTNITSNLNYVDDNLPVLTRENSQNLLILPNEIMITVNPELTINDNLTNFLSEHNLSLIRQTRLGNNTYLVSSNTAEGTEILNLVRQLEELPEIVNASPNFIQKISYNISNLTPIR